MSDQILPSVKEMLGLPTGDTGFEPELVTHINSVFADLQQMGVGPDGGFAITGTSQIWADFTDGKAVLNSVRAYMYLRVKMLFDPPSLGYLITSYEKMIEKAEWRLTTAGDELKDPPIVEEVVVVELVEE